MRSPRWERRAILNQVRRDVWRYITQAAQRETDLALEAAALLQMNDREVRRLGQVQFVLSDEVGRLLDAMPTLIRRLTNTTVHDEEWSLERIRGSIRWGQTYGARASTGLPHLHITAPARRAFQTPENELLTYSLRAISNTGRRTGWHQSTSPEVVAGPR